MRPLIITSPAALHVFNLQPLAKLLGWPGFVRIFGLAALIVVFCMVAGNRAAAQSGNSSGPPAVLGAHGSGGRGCLGCHPPHNDLSQSSAASRFESNFLWGGSAGPEYGHNFAIAETGTPVEVASSDMATAGAEVNGVLICLSCHDGNLTPQNMMASRSYTEKIGLSRFFRGQAIPSLIEQQQRRSPDHPMGVDAKIETGNGLEFSNGVFSVKPHTPYAHFVANYGWPLLAPLRRSSPYGVDAEGHPYLVCTTCHNQHVMNVYVSQPGSPIAGDGGSKSYTTFFFVNAPYNPDVKSATDMKSSSGAQFCRQCHFRNSNEANNTYFIPTWFQ